MKKFNASRKSAFTLAEVLITLGIIGVVAAMTMPTLLNQTNGAQYKAAYKKALSAIAQAVTLNVALDDWNFADLKATTADGETTEDTTYNLTSLLSTRMNVVSPSTDIPTDDPILTATITAGQTAKEAITATNYNRVAFADGITFYYPKNANNCTEASTTATDGTVTVNKCYGVIDVNGEKGPNRYVTCDEKTANLMDEFDEETLEEGAYDTTKTCAVKSPTDIYPVFFYDQTIVPASAAGKAVLYGK